MMFFILTRDDLRKFNLSAVRIRELLVLLDDLLRQRLHQLVVVNRFGLVRTGLGANWFELVRTSFLL